MKYLILLFLLLSACVSEAQFVTVTITVTNAPADGNTLVLNGGTRTFKSAVTIPASQIQIGADTNACTTNLYQQIAANPLQGVILSYVTNNVIKLQATTLTATFTGTWGIVNVSSQSTTNGGAVIVPVTTLPAATATNQMNNVVAGLEYAATLATATAPWLANYDSISAARTLSGNKTFTGVDTFTGANIYSNSTQQFIGGTNNGVYITNATSISGSNAVIYGMIVTSCVASNLINLGSLPFVSRGAGGNSEQIGQGASAIGSAGSAYGDFSHADSGGGTAIGEGANAGLSASALGYLANAGFNNSTAIGAGSAATIDHQVMLGTASENVYVPGNAQVAGLLVNLHASGTNVIDGDVAFLQKSIASLANGNNSAVPVSTNLYCKLSGPTGVFTVNGMLASGGNHNGCIRILQNSTGFTMTIANDSGTDPTASNRIYTGTGADVTEANNPGCVTLIYDASVTHWILVSKN